ncbi:MULTISPECIES: hypothetical protein [unclassified Microbulbifer]|uniref:hypothetical protein n=1 Tax=unclassified Microbulbifer TaxID=2619833 RepID=UPI0027E50AFD|nr:MULTISPECIES: hypothetical protein [unclassified Microbulbifer]
MNTCVDFKSDLFQPFLSEDAQVNPQCYGAELAWWLSQELAKRGVESSYPNSEDWGWFVEYIVDDNEYWLCCGNLDGEKNHWRVYLDPKAKSMFGRNKAPVEIAAPLLEALSRVLSESPEINEIQWSTGA